MRALLLVYVLAQAGCLRSTEFRCDTDTACGAGGTCESSGFCSFIDSSCDSGRRYGGASGSRANTCTDGGGTDIDASVDPDADGTIDGAMTDAPVAGCPSGYDTITGGETGHFYKAITAAASWQNQEAGCQATTLSAHLAVPADATEHTAIDTLAGTASYWIGISKSGNGWASTFGGAQTYLPWLGGTPSAAAMDTCVYSIPTTHMIVNDKCNTNMPAVCECVP